MAVVVRVLRGQTEGEADAEEARSASNPPALAPAAALAPAVQLPPLIPIDNSMFRGINWEGIRVFELHLEILDGDRVSFGDSGFHFSSAV